MQRTGRSKSRGDRGSSDVSPPPAEPVHVASDNMDAIISMLAKMQTQMSHMYNQQESINQRLSLMESHVTSNQQRASQVKSEFNTFATGVVIGTDSPNSQLSPGNDSSSSANSIVTEAASAQAKQTARTIVLDANLQAYIKGKGCLVQLCEGAVTTQFGALMKNGKKLRPKPAEELDLRQLARELHVASISGNRERTAVVISLVTAAGITWPYGGKFESDTLKLPVFTAECTHSPTTFIRWQSAVVEASKRVGVQDILLTPLDVLANRIYTNNVKVSDQSINELELLTMKAAIVSSFYDLSSQLYWRLKEAVESKEPIVLQAIDMDSKLHQSSSPPLVIEGNVNLLWRMLDEHYHRITPTAIESANRRIDSLQYGKKGRDSLVTSMATQQLVLDIMNANKELELIDKPRSEESLRSLLISRVPKDLWEHAQQLIARPANTLSYPELCSKLIEHVLLRSGEDRTTTVHQRINWE